jgi:hypothetical protein
MLQEDSTSSFFASAIDNIRDGCDAFKAMPHSKISASSFLFLTGTTI